jgi:hypothetical protein
VVVTGRDYYIGVSLMFRKWSRVLTDIHSFVQYNNGAAVTGPIYPTINAFCSQLTSACNTL